MLGLVDGGSIQLSQTLLGVVVGEFRQGDGDTTAILGQEGNDVILLANEDGGPELAGGYTVASSTIAMCSGDFNHDGFPDLAVTFYSDAFPTPQAGVSTLLADGMGGFLPQVQTLTGQTMGRLVAGNFYQYPYADLVVIMAGDDSLLLSDGNGMFLADPNESGLGFGPPNQHSIVAADFNNDGNLDVAVVSSVETVPPTGFLAILLGDGQGGFSEAWSNIAGEQPRQLVSADFNLDGNQDIAVLDVSGETVVIFEGFGDGGFGDAGIISVPAGPESIAVTDFNADGIPDLAVGVEAGPLVEVRLGEGGFNFAAPRSFGWVDGGILPVVATGDFNRDGRPDLVIADKNEGTVYYLFNEGCW